MAVKLNKAGLRAATALIKAGHYDMTASWSFSAEDGDKLLGSSGKDFAAFGKWHLGVDSGEPDDTKAHYKYPYGKDGKVYRRAVAAIRSRAKQNGAEEVFTAAGELMDAMDKEESDKQAAEEAALAARAEDDPPEDPEDDPEDPEAEPDPEDPEEDDENEDERAMTAALTRSVDALELIAARFAPSPAKGVHQRLGAMMGMEHKTLDPVARTVDMTVSTGAPVRRYDWQRGRDYLEALDINTKSIRLDRLNGGAALLDSHNYWEGTRSMLGSVVPGSARIEGGELRATAKFSTTEEGERAFQMAQDGTLRHVSVGYMTHEEEIDESTDPPTYRATDWEPYEVSAVAMPADPRAGFRSAVPILQPSQGEPQMSEQTAATVREAAVKEERERTQAIRDTGSRLRLPAEFIEKHVNDGTAIEAFRSAAIDAAAEVVAKRGVPENTGGNLTAPAVTGRHKARELTQKQKLGRLIRIYGAAKGDPTRAEILAKSDRFDDGNNEWQARALVAGIGASGGFMVPEEYYPEVIELLRHRAVVRRLGAIQIPMAGGNLNMPRLQGGATASYVGEAVATNASQETFGQVRFTERKLMAIVPVSNDLLKFASPQADEVVLNDMIAQIAVAEDAAFIRGAGTAYTPKGMRNWAPSAGVLTSAGTSLANFITDLEAMESALETNDVRMIDPAIILNPRSKNAIKLLQTTTGAFVFRDEMREGTLDGYKYAFTNNIPANLGTGAQTEWYMVDMADAVIADVPGLEIEISREAAYADSTGTIQAAFSQDVTVLRAIERHDFGMRHDVSVAVMTAVAY